MQPIEVQELRIITDHHRGIYGNIPQTNKEETERSERLDIDTNTGYLTNDAQQNFLAKLL